MDADYLNLGEEYDLNKDMFDDVANEFHMRSKRATYANYVKVSRMIYYFILLSQKFYQSRFTK